MLHHRKGSCVRAPRRFGARWSGLLLCVSVSLLLFYRLHISSWLLPYPFFSSSCPAAPPFPSLVAGPDHRLDWTTVTQHPVESFAQLPIPEQVHLTRIQYDFSRRGAGFVDKSLRKRQRAAVKNTFNHFWFSHRSKHTYSGKGSSKGNNLHMASLDTLWIMGLRKDFEHAVATITDHDFAPRDEIISMADTARHLNSLLSAYDLTFCNDRRLLSAAIQLGNMLYTFFDTPNRMPITHWNSTKATHGDPQETAQKSTIADLTSCNLAFTRLSQLTGNMRFYDATTHITRMLATQQNDTKIPGLWPTTINPTTADFTSANAFTPDTLSHAHLAQMSQLLHQYHASTPHASMLQTATEVTIRDIVFRPVTPTNESILAASSAYTIVLPKTKMRQVTLTHNITASSCSLGGTLALSAALSNGGEKDRLLTYARLLTQGCIWMSLHAPPSSSSSPSQHTDIKMMPDIFSVLACSSSALDNMDEDCSFDPTVWRKQEYPGFEVVFDSKKLVRPEVIQSVFYMWRVTGEREWLDVAWEMWESVDKSVRKGLGHHGDDEEMRMVVQTLKYFYLVFSTPNELSLDEWVIGSDGHAFRVSGA